MSNSSRTSNKRIRFTGDSYNTAAQYNTINSGNATAVNSNNTTDNSRIYVGSELNEFKDSTVYIGTTICSLPQYRIAVG
jgi:hypothetical protein